MKIQLNLLLILLFSYNQINTLPFAITSPLNGSITPVSCRTISIPYQGNVLAAGFLITGTSEPNVQIDVEVFSLEPSTISTVADTEGNWRVEGFAFFRTSQQITITAREKTITKPSMTIRTTLECQGQKIVCTSPDDALTLAIFIKYGQ